MGSCKVVGIGVSGGSGGCGGGCGGERGLMRLGGSGFELAEFGRVASEIRFKLGDSLLLTVDY